MSDPNVPAVRILRLPHGENLPPPAYATTGASGLDLVAANDGDAPMRLDPGARAMVPTGLAMALPPGFEAQIRPRSGLAAKFGVTVLNSPGTIDADYRGEVKVILINHGAEVFEIHRGDRIAQMVIGPVQQVRLAEADNLDVTDRGEGGFGSTGVGNKRR